MGRSVKSYRKSTFSDGGDSDFFFFPSSCHVAQFTFHISLPSLTFTIFIHCTTHNDFDSAVPNSIPDACHIKTQLNDLDLHEFSYWAQIERPPGVRVVMGSILVGNSDFFVVPWSCNHVWSIHFLHFISELKVQHLYSLINIIVIFIYPRKKVELSPFTHLLYPRTSQVKHSSWTFLISKLQWGWL